MNKKIEQIQKKLQEAKLERERKKAKYDSQTVIMEGQRQMLIQLENLNNEIMKEYMESHRTVEEFQSQLNKAFTEEAEELIANEKKSENE